MKIFLKLMVLVLIVGLAGPFILRAPDGNPYLQISDFIPSWPNLTLTMKRWWNNIGAQSSALEDLAASEDSDKFNTWGKVRVYRWRDKDGIWQYSDTLPKDGQTETELETIADLETMWLNPSENIIAGSAGKSVQDVAEEEDSAAGQSDFRLPLPLTVAPDKVPQLMEDARKVQQLMQQRNEMLESVTGESRQ